MSSRDVSKLTLGLVNASNNIKLLNNNIKDLSNNLNDINNFLENIYTTLDYQDNKFLEYINILNDLSNNVG
tara:strand:+ start:272 stop:484 length:213 start_codon:yes stop_codon:yes gene_type:complete